MLLSFALDVSAVCGAYFFSVNLLEPCLGGALVCYVCGCWRLFFSRQAQIFELTPTNAHPRHRRRLAADCWATRMRDWAAVLLLCWVVAAARPNDSLAGAIHTAIQPILINLSRTNNWETRQDGVRNGAWGFAYRDANTTVQLCAGYANNLTQVPCDPAHDAYAYGSTTKTTTAVLILRLLDRGTIPSLDDSIVIHANSYLRRISQNR